MLQRQKGFLIVTAVVIIVVIGLLSTALISMFMRSTEATLRLRAIPAANALAESGVEQAIYNFSQTNLNARQTCGNLATTISLATGDSITGLATNVSNNPRYAYASLSTAIAANSSPTTITVNDSSVFTPEGWVMIGREVFQYDYISNATTLGGVHRAQDGTQATDQVVGSLVSQYQCYIAGIGHAPANNPLSIREYQQGVRQTILFASGANGTILQWNGNATELAWSSQATGTALNLYSLSVLNYHSAWAAANQTSSGFDFFRLEGNPPWSLVVAALGQETDILGIDAPSTKEAWAVGRRQGSNTTLLRWVRDASNTSTNWCKVSTSSCAGISMSEASVQNAQKDIYAIKMYDLNGDGYADTGFAVGGSHDASGKVGVIWYYAASAWSSITQAPLNFSLPANTSELLGVDITRNGNATPQEVFFVGHNANAGGQLLRLRIVEGAAVWNALNPAQMLNAVSVVDTDGDGLADFGCAVGQNGSVIFFDSSMTTTTMTLSGSPTLNSVVAISPSDIWTVGNGGVSFHYDGSAWTSIATGTTNDLYSLSGVFPKQTMVSTWYELIN